MRHLSWSFAASVYPIVVHAYSQETRCRHQVLRLPSFVVLQVTFDDTLVLVLPCILAL